MSKGAVIVALPQVDDKVYRISSEKVPHLTMLYLGDITDSLEVPDIVSFVQHAAEHLDPFYLTVDYRGKLGQDEADVIFFEDNFWELPKLKTFRHQLLLNESIRRAHDSTEQFPEWRPHLTLGFPESPAKKDDDDYPGIHSVRFDRLAVWFGDYEGPEIRLKYDEHAMEVSMSDISTAALGEEAVGELFHYGVKGMRWGVRKSEGTQARADTMRARAERRSGKLGSAAEMRKANKLQKVADAQRARENKLSTRGKIRRGLTKANVATDAGAKIIREGEKKLIFLPHEHRQRAAGRTQTRMLSAARKVNQQPQFKGKDIKNNTQLKRSYFMKLQEEAKTIYAEELNISRTEAWGEFLGVDTSIATQQMRFNAAVDKIRHADAPTETLLVLDFITDENGFVTDISVPDEYLEHWDSHPDTIVHYGVKGMRWGVRNNADGTVSVNQTKVKKSLRKTDQPVTVTQRKAGTYVKARGGQRQTASTDAIKAQAARQKAKRSTTDSLSTKELKDAIERMRLEQEFAKLDKKVSRRGESFVSKVFGTPLAREAAQQVVKKVAEKN